MPLKASQKKNLRALAHHLKPVVWVGQHGLRDSVLGEVEIALDAHELIKVKLAAEKAERSAMIKLWGMDSCSTVIALLMPDFPIE